MSFVPTLDDWIAEEAGLLMMQIRTHIDVLLCDCVVETDDAEEFAELKENLERTIMTSVRNWYEHKKNPNPNIRREKSKR